MSADWFEVLGLDETQRRAFLNGLDTTNVESIAAKLRETVPFFGKEIFTDSCAFRGDEDGEKLDSLNELITNLVTKIAREIAAGSTIVPAPASSSSSRSTWSSALERLRAEIIRLSDEQRKTMIAYFLGLIEKALNPNTNVDEFAADLKRGGLLDLVVANENGNGGVGRQLVSKQQDVVPIPVQGQLRQVTQTIQRTESVQRGGLRDTINALTYLAIVVIIGLYVGHDMLKGDVSDLINFAVQFGKSEELKAYDALTLDALNSVLTDHKICVARRTFISNLPFGEEEKGDSCLDAARSRFDYITQGPLDQFIDKLTINEFNYLVDSGSFTERQLSDAGIDPNYARQLGLLQYTGIFSGDLQLTALARSKINRIRNDLPMLTQGEG